MLKPLVIASAVLFATAAYAQQQPQTPGTGQPNAQGEPQQPGRTMQEKDSSITTKDPKTQGTTGSAGTESGPTVPSPTPPK